MPSARSPRKKTARAGAGRATSRVAKRAVGRPKPARKAGAAGGTGPRAVTTYLTFSEKGEEAVRFYVSLFPNSKVRSISRWGPGGPVPEGSLQHAAFELDGQLFMAMDGGSYFSFGQGFSLYVDCETQEEVDRLWARLAEGGGQPQMCGWIKDRYGVSWQVVPSILGKLMADKDPGLVRRVTEAMLKMVKLDIAQLKAAAEP